MRNIKRHFQFALLTLITMFSFSIATPVANTASAACNAPRAILTFPAWQDGMPGTCAKPEIRKLNDVWIVVLNLLEMLIQAAAYISAGFIVWGGFKYIKSQGDPGKISESKMAIINAIIGLVIALASVAIVDFVQGGIAQS